MTSFKKSKSSNNWVGVDNDFGDFEPGEGNLYKTNKSVSRKRTRNENNNQIKLPRSVSESEVLFDDDPTKFTPLPESNSDETWVNKHRPMTVSDLVVNAKKVEEVRAWLKSGKGGILILLGPSGAGKTATLKLLAEEQRLCVTEWVNPIEQVNFGGNEGLLLDSRQRYDPQDTVSYSSKGKQFKDWLRGARYSQLDSNENSRSSSQLLLIEDLPNQAFSKPEEFQSSLEAFSGRKTKTSIVFIVSESASAKKSGSVKQVFPPEFISKLKIDTINFNPVTNTNMVKLMTNIATRESRGARKFKVPDKSTLEMLAESISGDIRGGINALQFSCLNDTLDLQKAFHCVNSLNNKSTAAKKKLVRSVDKSSGDGSTQLSKIGGRDQSLVMFHALGKILYSKRTEELETFPLPPQLETYRRKNLVACPEEVLSHTTLPPDPFTAFLHHNFPPFFSQLQDVVRLSDYMSSADLLLQEWSTQGKVALSEYGASVACRAVMHCNTGLPPNLGMRKLTKPEFYTCARTLRNREQAVQAIFHTQNIRELATSTLPLMARIGYNVFSPSQMATITEVGKFPGLKSVSMRYMGSLEQNDVFDEEEELKESQKVVDEQEAELIPINNEEEELLIEEFDD